MSKKMDYNPPADLLSRLPGKPIITTGDKLAALQTMFHRCEIGWRGLHLPIINAIREDIRLSAWRKREQAQKGSAPVRPEAPSRPEQRSEAGSRGDVVRLLVVGHEHRAALVVDAVLGVVVADALDDVARDLDVVHVRVGRDLAGQHHQAGVGQRLGGDAADRVLLEDRIQDRVADLVGHLVGMALADRFAGEQEVVVACHFVNSTKENRFRTIGCVAPDSKPGSLRRTL